MVLTWERPLPGFQKELILFTPWATGLFCWFGLCFLGRRTARSDSLLRGHGTVFNSLCFMRLLDTLVLGPAYPVCSSPAVVTQPRLRGDRDSELTIKATLFLSARQEEGSTSQAPALTGNPGGAP